MANGRMAKKELARVYHPSLELYLAKDAAAAWNTMRMFSKRRLKVDLYPGGPDSAYRTVARQQYWRNWWCAQGSCGNAAVVGTSNHGNGEAIDLPTRTMRFAIDRVGERFGYAKKWSDGAQEWWHIKYTHGKWSHPDPGIDFYNPILRKGSGGVGQDWAVNALQKHLIRHKFLNKKKPDGFFGVGTDTAVKSFQKAAKLKADGVVGAKTWARLRRKTTPVLVTAKPKAKAKAPVAAKPDVVRGQAKGKAATKPKETKATPKAKKPTPKPKGK